MQRSGIRVLVRTIMLEFPDFTSLHPGYALFIIHYSLFTIHYSLPSQAIAQDVQRILDLSFFLEQCK